MLLQSNKIIIYGKGGERKILDKEQMLLLFKWRENILIGIKYAVFNPKILFYFIERKFKQFFFKQKIIDNRKMLEGIIGLKPEKIEVICNNRNFLFERAHTDHIENIIFLNQYQLKPSLVKNKVVVDVGANVGTFSILAAKMGAKKVWAFEPVKETFRILKKNIKLNELEGIVIPVCCALGEKSKKGKIYYTGGGDGGATMYKERHKHSNLKTQAMAIEPLDRMIKEPVDYIKIDSEGNEKNILLGAKKIIRRWRPNLVFSAYHWKNDKSELPLVVFQMCENYQCKLINTGEEIFICHTKNYSGRGLATNRSKRN